jgi:hypothetical protein
LYLETQAKYFVLGAIGSSIAIDFVVVPYLVWKVFCKLLWMLSPLFFLCSKGKLWGITIGLEEWL